MCSIGVQVDATIEHSCSILPNTAGDHGLPAWMILDKVTDVVDDTCNGDQGAAVLGLVDVVVPFHYGELVERNTPVETGSFLVELLLELLDTALLDFVGLELLEVVGEADLLAEPDGPFGGIILVPLDGVSVVGRELVMKVVIAFTESDESGDDVVAGRVAVVKWLVAEPVGERVDAEGGLLDEEDTEDASIDESAKVVAPAETSNESGEDKAHEEDNLEIIFVLPNDDGVLVEITDIGTADPLWVLLHDHPTEVGVEQALADRVWVLVGIGVAVMGTVVTSPPASRALNGTTTNSSPEDAERKCGTVGCMSPKAVISCCDAQASSEVVCNGP